jgi:hypothetical protein
MNRKLLCGALILTFTFIVGMVFMFKPLSVKASDHDDGELDAKGRANNLTDVFVFREGDQTGNAADNANLIMIMTVNPRSIARQQYFFSQRAHYEFHIAGAQNSNSSPTGVENAVLRFAFAAPDSNSQQAITTTIVPYSGGQANEAADVTLGSAETTAAPPGLGMANFSAQDGTRADSPLNNTIAVNAGGQSGNLTLFAGPREDQFFFDVEQFFRVRAGLAGAGPSVGFNPPGTARDSFAGFNVLGIVVRAPINVLQGITGQAGATTFDVWATVSLPSTIGVP